MEQHVSLPTNLGYALCIFTMLFEAYKYTFLFSDTEGERVT